MRIETYYKTHHLTRDSFPELSPDEAESIISTHGRLERELGCEVFVDRKEHCGYCFRVMGANPCEFPTTYEGHEVVYDDCFKP